MFENAKEILKEGIDKCAYPSAAFAIGCRDEIYLNDVLGYRQVFPEKISADTDTLYDMASLTKLICTTMVALRLIEDGKLLLTDTLKDFFNTENAPQGRADVTVKHLMMHTSGITPHIALWRHELFSGEDYRGGVIVDSARDKEKIYKIIIESEPFCKVGEQVYYSCMGYILLCGIIEKITGESLDKLCRKYVFKTLDMHSTCFNPTVDNVATTEYSSLRGKYIKGEVHDENAHFQGGVSGNAGVFSNLHDMSNFAKMLACRGIFNGEHYISERMFDIAIKNYTHGMNESRGLGFQLKPEFSSFHGGDLLSDGSYGHTGFTGTSLFVDRECGLWILLMTNTVHFGRDKTQFFRYRRRFYNSVVSEYFKK